jgi:hypothetical protein
MGSYVSSGHASGGQHGLKTDSSHNADRIVNPAEYRGRRGTYYGLYTPEEAHPHVKDMLKVPFLLASLAPRVTLARTGTARELAWWCEHCLYGCAALPG